MGSLRRPIYAVDSREGGETRELRGVADPSERPVREGSGGGVAFLIGYSSCGVGVAQ